jgi:hypothetical protein
MEKYRELEMEIILSFEQDIITSSKTEGADDLGEWNNNWFTQGNK